MNVGNKDIVNYFISKGALDYQTLKAGLERAKADGNTELVNLFLSKGIRE